MSYETFRLLRYPATIAFFSCVEACEKLELMKGKGSNEGLALQRRSTLRRLSRGKKIPGSAPALHTSKNFTYDATANDNRCIMLAPTSHAYGA
mmetsp:Transcript_4833/g.8235  ORF Transcript_4833/g.8235 Transcript_4833/m.8235 type:complete len:93 (-) Transcript_4833:677-955(-)